MMEIDFLGYKIGGFLDIELYGLTIAPKSSQDTPFRVFIERSEIRVANWFAFLAIVLSIRFLNNRYIALLLNLACRWSSRTIIARLKLDGVEIYYPKTRRSGSSSSQNHRKVVETLCSYFDVELSNVRMLAEFGQADGSWLLLGTEIGFVSKKTGSSGRASLLVRRASVRCCVSLGGVFARKAFGKVRLRTLFASVFKDSKAVVSSFTGLLGIDVVNSDDGWTVSLLETNIDNAYSGIYLSLPLLSSVLVALLPPSSHRNGGGSVQGLFGWRLGVLVSFKKIVLDVCEDSSRLFLTADSIKLSLDSASLRSRSLSIRLLNCFVMINPENAINVSDFKARFDLNDCLEVKTCASQLRLYSKVVHSDHLNSFIDVLELPEINTLTRQVRYCGGRLTLSTSVEISEELLVIKSTGTDNVFFHCPGFKAHVSDLLDFPPRDGTAGNLQFDVFPEPAKDKSLSVQAELSFGSNIQLIYDMYNVELLVEGSKAGLVYNSGEVRLEISDVEFVQHSCSNEEVFRLSARSVLARFQGPNKSIVFRGIFAGAAGEIRICSDEVTIYKSGDSRHASALNSAICLHLSAPLGSDSALLWLRTEGMDVVFQESLRSWEYVELKNICIEEHVSHEDSLHCELLKAEGSPIKIFRGSKDGRTLNVDVPKLLLQVNRSQLSKLSHVISRVKGHSVGSGPTRNSYRLKLNLNDTSIHYYGRNEEASCTTVLTHFGHGCFAVAVDEQLGLSIDSEVSQIEVMAGEVWLGDSKATVQLPHYSETLYSRLQQSRMCHDIVYFEMAKQAEASTGFAQKGQVVEVSEPKEGLFPILISGLGVTHKFRASLSRHAKATFYHSMANSGDSGGAGGPDSARDEAFLVVLVSTHDLFDQKGMFSAGGSQDDLLGARQLLQRLCDYSLFTTRLQSVNVILMRDQLESEYLVFSLDGVSLSNSTQLKLSIERLQMLVKHPSRSFTGEYLSVSIDNNLFKARLSVLDSRTVLRAEALDLSSVDKKEVEFRVGEVKLGVSGCLVRVVGDFFKGRNDVATPKSQTCSIKYFQGASSFARLSDLRQSPTFVSNVVSVLDQQVSLIPYFYIDCLSDAKFSVKEVEVPLACNSRYLLDLNNSFFCHPHSNYSQLYYSRYFNDHTYFVSCRLRLDEESQIPFSNICEFSTNYAVVGQRVCFSSRVLGDCLLLSFGSDAVPASDGTSERVVRLGKDQTVEVPLGLIIRHPNLRLFRQGHFLTANFSCSDFCRNGNLAAINIVEMIKNACGNRGTSYLDCSSLSPGLCIGLECVNAGDSSIKIAIFNTLSIVNVCGEPLGYSLNTAGPRCGAECMYTIDSLQRAFIDNVDTRESLILLIRGVDSGETACCYRIDLKEGRHSLLSDQDRGSAETSETELQATSADYRLSLVRSDISYVILVWSPLIVLNYSSLSYMLLVTDQGRQYCLQGERRSSSGRKVTSEEASLSADTGSKDRVTLRIQVDHYLKTTCSAPGRRGDNLLIQVEDYRNHIGDNQFILDALEASSTEIRLLKLLPRWVIRNKSSFDINVTCGECTNVPVRSRTGSLDVTGLAGYESPGSGVQEQVSILFDGFINSFLVDLSRLEPFEKLVNLYHCDQTPNKTWGLVRISFNPRPKDGDPDFNAGVHLELSDFSQTVCSDYLVFENRTSFGYLVTQPSASEDLSGPDLSIPEGLSHEVWDKTLIQRFSRLLPRDNKEVTKGGPPFPACLIPGKTEDRLFFLAKEGTTQEGQDSLAISFYDEPSGTKVSLGLVPVSLPIGEGERPIQFVYSDPRGSCCLCRLLLSVFKLDSGVTHVLFRSCSLTRTVNTRLHALLTQERDSGSPLAIGQSLWKMSHSFVASLGRLELTLFVDGDVSQVLRVRRISSPSSRGFFLVPSSRESRSLPGLTPALHLVFELLLVNIRREKGVCGFGPFDAVFKADSSIGSVYCGVSGDDARAAVLEMSCGRGWGDSERQITLSFGCFELRSRLANRYQVRDLRVSVSFVELDLNLNAYFRSVLRSLLADSEEQSNSPADKPSWMVIDVFPSRLDVRELVVNKRLSVLNLRHSTESPRKVEIRGWDSLLDLSKHVIKRASYTIIKTLLNKSLNPLIYLLKTF